jgi:hypothetical protein
VIRKKCDCAPREKQTGPFHFGLVNVPRQYAVEQTRRTFIGSIQSMKKTHSNGTARTATQDLDLLAIAARRQRDKRSIPEVSCECDEPDFVEGHEDPAQSEELERQQDA